MYESELATLDTIILFIRADAQGCLKGGVNIGFAALLSAWTEFFGHCLTNDEDGDQTNKDAYNAWLRFMGPPYGALLNKGVKLYDRVRCGTIHEFAIKKGAEIFSEPNYPGIEIVDDNIRFNNKQFAEDFINSIERYRVAINTDEELGRKLHEWLSRKKIVVV